MLIRLFIDSPLTTLTFISFLLFFLVFLIPLMKNEKKWARALRQWGKA